ncbi:MAG: hypothetical protein IPP96_10495 [Chitinophagaceae bacterium]|nr:hypothetical protein [Chitinophagaceae bacterium]
MKLNNKNISFLERIGQYLILASILGFVAAIVMSCIPASVTYIDGIASDGTIAAVSVVFLLMGSVFAMPGILMEDGKDKQTFSTMRFMVLTVALVFAAITIKIGWQTSSFEDFKIHSTWVYILGLAFGAKVAQKMTEEPSDDTAADDTAEDPADKNKVPPTK